MRLNKEKTDNALYICNSKVKVKEIYDEFAKYADKNEVINAAIDFAISIWPERKEYDANNPFGEPTGKITEERIRKDIRNYMMEKDIYSLYHNKAGSNITKRYLCCPKCHHFSGIDEWVSPIGGWEEIRKNAATHIFSEFLVSAAAHYMMCYRRTRFNTPEDEILLGILHHSKESTFGCDKKDFLLTGNDTLLFKCPNCGEAIPLNENSEKKRMFAEPYDCYSLTRDAATWFENNHIDVNYEIYENGDKVTLAILEWHLFPNIFGKMHIQKVSKRVTFNTKTGRSYEFRDLDIVTGKVMPYHKNNPRMRNSTYGMYYFMPHKEVATDMAKKICEKKGIPLIVAEDIKPERLKIGYMDFLNALNRYGEYGVDFLLVYLSCDRRIKKSQKRDLFKMLDDQSIFKDYLGKYKVCGKKRTKLYAKNPLLFFEEDLLVRIGFKNSDVRLNLIENHQEWLGKRYAETVTYERNIDKVAEFIHDYTELKTEAEIARKITELNKYDWMFISDIGGAYCEIRDRLNLDRKTKMCLFSGNLGEIHDRMYQVRDTFHYAHYYIPYTEKEIGLNCKCGDFKFTLAKTTLELKAIGNKMGICVGGYGHVALNRSSVIVIMYDKDDVPAACIELTSDMKMLVQFKDYYNKALKEEKRDVAVLFLNRNHIDYSDCSDAIRANFCDADTKNVSFERMDDKTGYKYFNNKEDFRTIPLDEEMLQNAYSMIISGHTAERRELQFEDEPFMELPLF